MKRKHWLIVSFVLLIGTVLIFVVFKNSIFKDDSIDESIINNVSSEESKENSNYDESNRTNIEQSKEHSYDERVIEEFKNIYEEELNGIPSEHREEGKKKFEDALGGAWDELETWVKFYELEKEIKWVERISHYTKLSDDIAYKKNENCERLVDIIKTDEERDEYRKYEVQKHDDNVSLKRIYDDENNNSDGFQYVFTKADEEAYEYVYSVFRKDTYYTGVDEHFYLDSIFVYGNNFYSFRSNSKKYSLVYSENDQVPEYIWAPGEDEIEEGYVYQCKKIENHWYHVYFVQELYADTEIGVSIDLEKQIYYFDLYAKLMH